jgi:DNA-binding MarR family transcriptional regulator/GNAT superfamily N-acetyltransferase
MTVRQRERRIAENRIATVRRFNRFYTRQIGVLRKDFLGTSYSLGEARVLYEIASRQAPTASEVGRALDLDAGYLSRVLGSFERRGLIRRTASPKDARQSHLALSARGRQALAPLDRRSQDAMAAMLKKLAPTNQQRLIAAMTAIETLLDGNAATAPPHRAYALRAPAPGDFGWIVKRHAELYAQEYGWTEPFEGVCAKIVADYANVNDPKRERCWIAEMNGENVGCIFLVKDSAKIARIRLLLVDPQARGLGLGVRLVDECISFARHAGYKKITLWTHSVLTAARHIYKKAGFRLMRTERHRSWGRPVVSEFWDLEL